MSVEYLVARLGDDASIDCWAVFDADGRVVRRIERGPAGAAEAARGRRVIALVPGVEVVSTSANLPKSSQSRLRKMLPYSLEDALAQDVEDLFFAAGPRLDSGAVAVAVVARARLEEWLDVLAADGLVPHVVCSDADGVPDTPSTLTLIVEGERVYGRVPGQQPFVFEGLSLQDVVDALGDDVPKHAIVYLGDESEAELHRDALRRLADELSGVDVKMLAGGAFYRLAATLTQRPGTNLLQGRYTPKSNWPVLLRPWRVAAALLGGVVLLALIGQVADFVSLRQQDRALTEVLTERCAQSFSSSRLEDCEAAARSRLSDSGLLEEPDAADFLTVLNAVAQHRSPESRVEALSYRNDVLDLQLTVPDIPALDALAQQIEGSEQLDVMIQSANPGSSGVEGRVQIVGAPQ